VGDRVRLEISNLQAGYLYILNEGPAKNEQPARRAGSRPKDGLPDINILFPAASAMEGSPEIPAGTVVHLPPRSGNPKKGWLAFDDEVGSEKIWLVWSKRRVPELEAVTRWLNPKDGGAILDAKQRESVRNYLTTLSASEPVVERDEASGQTRLSSGGEVLAWAMKLEHR
jgi:hypothetical protein